MILLLHPLIGSYGSHTVGLIPCTKYIISWMSHDFKQIPSRDQVQIWGLTSYSNTPRMEIPSAWLGTTEFIYLAVLQQSIQVDRVIVSWCNHVIKGHVITQFIYFHCENLVAFCICEDGVRSRVLAWMDRSLEFWEYTKRSIKLNEFFFWLLNFKTLTIILNQPSPWSLQLFKSRIH